VTKLHNWKRHKSLDNLRTLSTVVSLMARFRAYTSDSSDDDDDQVLQQHRAPRNVSANAEYSDEDSEDESDSSPSPSSSSEMDEDELMVASNALVEDEDGEYRYGHELNHAKSPPASNRDPTIIPRAHTVGIDAQRMHVMQTSLFRMPEEAAALKAMNKPPRTSLRISDQPLNRKHSRDSDGDGLRVDSKEVCFCPLRSFLGLYYFSFHCSARHLPMTLNSHHIDRHENMLALKTLLRWSRRQKMH